MELWRLVEPASPEYHPGARHDSDIQDAGAIPGLNWPKRFTRLKAVQGSVVFSAQQAPVHLFSQQGLWP